MMLGLLGITKRMIGYVLLEGSVHPSLPADAKALEIVKNFRAIPDRDQLLFMR
jgi:hypothetical protein